MGHNFGLRILNTRIRISDGSNLRRPALIHTYTYICLLPKHIQSIRKNSQEIYIYTDRFSHFNPYLVVIDNILGNLR